MVTPPSGEGRVLVRLLGGFQVWCGDHEVVLPPMSQHVVARVALTGRMPRAALAGQLWPDLPERRAQANLRTSLWQVRRLAPTVLVHTGECVALPAAAEVDLHLTQARALAVVRDATAVPTDALMTHLHALELLPGWYDEWVLAERERDRQLRLHALELAAHALLDRGLAGAAMHAALAAVQLEPLRESAHRAVITIHLSEGNVAQALDQYALYRSVVLAEFGIEPTPSLQELVGGVAHGAPAAPRPPQRSGGPARPAVRAGWTA